MSKNNAAQPREVWIHVCENGRDEIVFEADPRRLKSLRVEERDGFQLTKTWNQGATGEPIPPPGAGWVMHDDTDKTFTVWRRATRQVP